MPLSANLLKLESSILTRAKRATNRNNVATEKRIKKMFWHRIVPATKCPAPKYPAPKRRRRIGGAETYPTPYIGIVLMGIIVSGNFLGIVCCMWEFRCLWWEFTYGGMNWEEKRSGSIHPLAQICIMLKYK